MEGEDAGFLTQATVLLAVPIQNLLRPSCSMHRCQKTLRYTECIVKHFQDRSHAISRTAGIGDDAAVLGGRVRVGVHTVDKGRRIRARCRDQNPLCLAMCNMFYRKIPLGELPGAFENVIDSNSRPVQLLQVALGCKSDLFAADGDEMV